MLPDIIALVACVTFIALALWHFHMAFSTATGESAAVPSVDGKPLFKPSRISTIAVGVALVMFALLVACTARWFAPGLPPALPAWASYALALGLFARALGDFKYVGFFKSVRGSRFAKMDTRLYSPLCLLLSMGVATNAVLRNG